jgi:hypothetical protein
VNGFYSHTGHKPIYLLAPVTTRPMRQAVARANCWWIWEQENGSRRALVPVRERKTWLWAPVGEQKPCLEERSSKRCLVPGGTLVPKGV